MSKQVRVSVDIAVPDDCGEAEQFAMAWLAATLSAARLWRTARGKELDADTAVLLPHPYDVEIVGAEVID